MSWTNDVILEFIDLYRQEQLLWDPRHPLHRNRSEVNDAWLRIQSSLSISCSVMDLKKKKESLMTQFRMHHNKKKKSPDVYRTTWFAFSIMESFLGERYEGENDTSTNNLDEEFFNNSPLYTESPVVEHQYTPRSAIAAERINNNKAKFSTVSKTNDIKVKCFNNSESLYMKRQIDKTKETNEERKDMDEYDLYGELLVKKLRKLDEHQRDIAMHEIDNIMFRAKMQSVTPQSQTRSYPSSPSPVPRKVKSPLFIVAQPTHAPYEEESIYQQDPMQTQPST